LDDERSDVVEEDAAWVAGDVGCDTERNAFFLVVDERRKDVEVVVEVRRHVDHVGQRIGRAKGDIELEWPHGLWWSRWGITAKGLAEAEAKSSEDDQDRRDTHLHSVFLTIAVFQKNQAKPKSPTANRSKR